MNTLAVKEKLQQFLLEDIRDGDLTSEAIFSEVDEGVATIVAKDDGILAGSQLISLTMSLVDPNVRVNLYKNDCETIHKGDVIAHLEGSIRSILTTERVILNLLQRMSGIATITKRAVERLDSDHTKICDTRKTTPGLRIFEKYAVTCGGGVNHRQNLNDGVMIKDNHIAFSGSISKAVERVKKAIGPMVKIEVETETEEQVKEAVAAGCDIIMFDNRTPEEVAKLNALVPDTIITEASGGITLDNVATYRNTGVDYISLGFLTHSVEVLDMSMLMEDLS